MLANGRSWNSFLATPMIQHHSPDLDGLMRLLALVALLLYLAPAVFRPDERASLWLRRAAAATLAIGVMIAIAAGVAWFMS